jgi:hypothetical protein
MAGMEMDHEMDQGMESDDMSDAMGMDADDEPMEEDES